MAPFKTLFGRRCRSPIGWFKVGDMKSLGIDLVKEAQEKVSFIQGKPLTVHSRKNEDANFKLNNMSFKIGEQVLLKVSPIKGVMQFGKKGKLCP